jgi:hypothetical protein
MSGFLPNLACFQIDVLSNLCYFLSYGKTFGE